MEANATTWIRDKAEAFLARIGVRQGRTVLDFGCNDGNYTIPAARIVGDGGTVYAVDKNRDSLKGLRREVREKGLRNIELLPVRKDRDLPMQSSSVDVVLLYDTLHGGYFPEAAERSRVLQRIHRVLRPGGLLSCYPTDLKRYGMTFNEIVGEITNIGFRCHDKHYRELVHDGRLVRGWVFNFTRDS